MKRILCMVALMVFARMALAQAGQQPSMPSGQNMPAQQMPSGQTAAATPDEQQLLGIEQQLAEAMKSGDANALGRIEADGYVFTSPTGQLSGKQQGMNNLKSGQLKFQSFEISDLQPHLYGDTAVVTGRSKVQGVYNAQNFGGEYAFTDTFVKQNGRWELVSTQITRLAGESMAPASPQAPPPQAPPPPPQK